MARILVIDDIPEITESLKILLEIEGHSVSTASSGKEGLDLLSREKADIVITDIVMPEKEGLETISELKRKHYGVKIIAISGGGNRGDAKDYLTLAYGLGADRTLEKPIASERLLKEIKDLLGEG